MSNANYQRVYNTQSFSLASMIATSRFSGMRLPASSAKHQSVVIISGMVTFIAAYHHRRFFSSWPESITTRKGGCLPSQFASDSYSCSPCVMGVQHFVVLFGFHDGNFTLLVDASARQQCQEPERRNYFLYGDLHCRIPLPTHLEQLYCLRKLADNCTGLQGFVVYNVC
jgi:hypothetical protein